MSSATPLFMTSPTSSSQRTSPPPLEKEPLVTTPSHSSSSPSPMDIDACSSSSVSATNSPNGQQRPPVRFQLSAMSPAQARRRERASYAFKRRYDEMSRTVESKHIDEGNGSCESQCDSELEWVERARSRLRDGTAAAAALTSEKSKTTQETNPEVEVEVMRRRAIANAQALSADPFALSSAPSAVPMPAPAADAADLPSASSSPSISSALSSSISPQQHWRRLHHLIHSSKHPLPCHLLQVYFGDNERLHMHSFYSEYLVRREQEQRQCAVLAQQLSARKGQSVPLKKQSLRARLHDEAVKLNSTSYHVVKRFKIGSGTSQDKSQLTCPTRFRGGSAIDYIFMRQEHELQLVLNRFNSVPTLYQAFRVSIVISLFQHGLTINHDDKSWQPYHAASLELMRSIDAGQIPLLLSTLAQSGHRPAFFFYDGCLIGEIRDFRDVTSYGGGMTEPACHYCLLRPTAECIQSDVNWLIRENELHTLPDATELALAVQNEVLKVNHTLCLDPNPRVFQVLNLAHYNSKRVFVKGISSALARQRLLELHEDMQECLFGPDLQTLTNGAVALGGAATPDNSNTDSPPIHQLSKAEMLLSRQPALSEPARLRLREYVQKSGKICPASEVSVVQQSFIQASWSPPVYRNEEKMRDNRYDRLIDDNDVAAALVSNDLAISETRDKLVVDGKFAPRPSGITVPLTLAYASFVHYTHHSRYLAASNALLTDPITRNEHLSGPMPQNHDADADHHAKMRAYEMQRKAAENNNVSLPAPNPPSRVNPVTIASQLSEHQTPSSKVKERKFPPAWRAYKFTVSMSNGSPRKLLIELHIHAIYLSVSPSFLYPDIKHNPAVPQQQASVFSGQFEAYIRVSVLDAHEIPPPALVAPLGNERQADLFLQKYLHQARLEEQTIHGNPVASSRPTIELHNEDAFFAELEARAAKANRLQLDATLKRQQQQQQQLQQQQQQQQLQLQQQQSIQQAHVSRSSH